MSHILALPARPPSSSIRRRLGASLALAAAIAFAFQPTLLLAQSTEPDVAPVKAQPKPKPAKTASAKKPSRHMANDNVSDDLNRREAERTAQIIRDMTATPAPAAAAAAAAPSPVAAKVVATPVAKPAVMPAVEAKPAASPALAKATDSEPPTVAAIPPRAPIVSASLTPDVGTQPAPPAMPTAPAVTEPAPPAPVLPSATPQRQQAQARPPAPVPIQPPAAGGTATPPPAAGVPTRSFAQSQIVPTQQPTLNLEVNKGTAIKLPGPAATVFVAAPDIADVQVKSPGMIYVFAKKPGETVLYAVDDQDRVLLNTIVSVNSPVSRMKAALEAQHPGNGVIIDNQGETIVLSGTVRSAVIAEDARRIALAHITGTAKVINNIRIDAPTQVQLRVKVAEVNRDALKRVGVNWQNINGLGVAPLVGALSSGFAVSTVSATGGAPSALLRFSGGNFDALIDFLATQSQATILAEPNMTAMSGETASFLAGGEIPVIAPQGGLTTAITVTYKQVGVSLNFTPTILGDRINLKVAPEVSQVSTNGQVSVPISPTASIIVPAIQTRRASTTVELGSGQSFAIAGLLQQTSQQDIKKMPWLGDVPVLGTLFKSDAYQRNETELVIIVTPYFVEPSSGPLRTPLTGRVPPTDADRILLQRLDHPTPPQRISGGGGRYAGPSAGFKLD